MKILKIRQRKGGDVITLIKEIGKVICIVAFAAACITLLIGIFTSNKRMLWASVITLLASGLCYAGITCSNVIVKYIAAWARS